MTKESINEFTLRITHANKTEMIVILYDIAITYLQDALKGLEYGDYVGFKNDINRTRGVLRELTDSVDNSVRAGRSLIQLYVKCNGELTTAVLEKRSEPVKLVLDILGELKKAYEEFARADMSEAIMEHTEEVYTGFTYNKNLRSETIAPGDANRGYLV